MPHKGLTGKVILIRNQILCFEQQIWKGREWSGGAKVLCILHHWGVQLILAYSWARPAILVVGKGRGGMFLFLLFLHFHSCSSFFPVPLFHLLYSLFYLFFSLSLGDDTKWPSRVDMSLNPNTINLKRLPLETKNTQNLSQLSTLPWLPKYLDWKDLVNSVNPGFWCQTAVSDHGLHVCHSSCICRLINR